MKIMLPPFLILGFLSLPILLALFILTYLFPDDEPNDEK